jgi:ubiquinone/menaquinone biosynthesis C-methylase UbiE
MGTDSQNFLTFEQYGPGYRPKLVSQHNSRTASRDAGFALPFISNPKIIVDCGCGRGSITIGLAELFPEAQVIGFDIGEEVIAAARSDAEAAALGNIEFRIGSIYHLPLDDDCCDVVFANAVVQHLARPELALGEFYRVLRPGGLVGLRDDDRGSMVLAPISDAMIEALAIMDWYLADSEGDPFAGRRHRERLTSAGFGEIVCSATVEADADLNATARRGALAADAFRGRLGERAVQAGKIDQAGRTRLAEACDNWGNDPAAFDCITWCEAVGRKPA